MGGMISTLRYVLHIIRASIEQYDSLSKRIAASPGIPQLPPTSSKGSLSAPVPYWTVPASPIARHGETAQLPHGEVDVVIIGSGITGTAIAKALLEYAPELDEERSGQKSETRDIRVVMLEARDACSGSTGRNGGHIGPIIYDEYRELRDTFGASTAEEILRFRLAHISSLISTAQDEGLLSASQAREVEGFDIYAHPKKFEGAKEELHEFLAQAPADLTKGFKLIDDSKTMEKLQLVPSMLGCISKPGGAIHPYRFVTGILSNLLNRYSNFQLFTRTPCTQISSNNAGYIVRTPRGDIRTTHIIHATNAWSSHLLSGMRGKIVPTRTSMTAQRPGRGLSKSWAGTRAFVFYPIEDGSVFEYLTQLLPVPIPDERSGGASLPTSGEFLFGGRMQPSFTNNIGIADDSCAIFENEAHLGGALERTFAPHWGREGDDDTNETECDGVSPQQVWGKGRLKAAWSGLLGMSADLQPWVGRVPRAASGRMEPAARRSAFHDERDGPRLAAPGEWICAGYTGEGMVHAWLSGRALAHMVLGVSAGESGERTFPSPFLITERRLREARFEDTITRW